MRFTESISMVASGCVGPGITNDGDSNVYVIKGPDGYIMVDVGCGVETERILQQLEWDGINPKDINAILITHAHWDHVAGLPFWRELTGADVYVPAEHVELVENGGMYYETVEQCKPLKPSPGVNAVSVGDVFNVCGIEVRALEGKGHTDGALYFLFEVEGRRVLACGDSFYHGGKLTVFCWPDSDLAVFKQTLLDLQNVSFDVVLPGHRFPFMTEAEVHLELAIKEADRQLAGEAPCVG